MARPILEPIWGDRHPDRLTVRERLAYDLFVTRMGKSEVTGGEYVKLVAVNCAEVADAFCKTWE